VQAGPSLDVVVRTEVSAFAGEMVPAVKQATVNPAIPNPIPALRIAWRSHRGVRTASASRADCAADKCRKRIGGEKVLVDASAADLNFASS
jgi:hypothetical protein